MASRRLVYAQRTASRLSRLSTHVQLTANLSPQIRRQSSEVQVLPKIAQPSLWHSIVPRSLRSRSERLPGANRQKPVNPASYFIWIFILIGSQAIRILQLENDLRTFTRQADLKIDKLREVVDALQRGEDVDVEASLGTGNDAQEREWEDVLKEIENEDRLWQINRQKSREAQAKAREQAAREANEDTASPVNDSIEPHPEVNDKGPPRDDREPRAPGFY